MLRVLLLQLAKNRRLGHWITSHRIGQRLASRFVPGEHLDQAIAAGWDCNQQGMTVSLDHLGENVGTRQEAERARDAYIEVLNRISRERLNGNISLKLTQLGLDLDEEFCVAQLQAVASCAAKLGNFARVDMEGSTYTDSTLRIVRQVLAETGSIGTVIQAYLYRSEDDVRELLRAGCRIRLVKGAYKEPSNLALPQKKDVDANYSKLMRLLLTSGIYHAVATHDPKMIDATMRFAAEQGIGKDKFEFQMLYGIRTDLQASLVREGYRMRVYIPFGEDWFPYFMRRLAERPANVIFLAKNLLPHRDDDIRGV